MPVYPRTRHRAASLTVPEGNAFILKKMVVLNPFWLIPKMPVTQSICMPATKPKCAAYLNKQASSLRVSSSTSVTNIPIDLLTISN